MSKKHYDPIDLPFLAGTSPVAETFPFRDVMPALYIFGCNLRCSYCINRGLLGDDNTRFDALQAIGAYHRAREPWLMISGAEALLNPKTPNLLFFIKSLGMMTAVATNGTNPELLKTLINDGLVDHVAMDIKAPLRLDRYSRISPHGMNDVVMGNIISCAEMLRDYPRKLFTSCHFRTTVCGAYLNLDDIIEIAEFLGSESTYVLQPYAIHQTLDPSLSDPSYIVSYEELSKWVPALSDIVRNIYISEV